MNKWLKSKKRFGTFAVEASGATLVEYGVALLVVVIVGATAMAGLATAVGEELGETASAF